jgi:oxygen-dependent protoporphyrinogen oxidase
MTAAEEQCFDAPDDDVVEIALSTLCRLWPELRDSVDFTHIHRWAQAIPHTQVGTYQKIADFTAAPDPASRVQFAADYMSATGQNTGGSARRPRAQTGRPGGPAVVTTTPSGS